MNPKFFWLITAIFLAYIPPAGAQQLGTPRIGFASGTGDPSASTTQPQLTAFRQGLRSLGYAEGKNIVIEFRSAEGKPDRLPSIVGELLQEKVDALVVSSLIAIRAAKETTKTVPIIMVTTVDPVSAGLIDSLRRPGGNITGVTRLTRELSGKRLELLRELVPNISRVGVLWDGGAPSSAIAFKEYEAAAHSLQLQLLSLDVRDPNPDLDSAFQTAIKGRASAVLTIRGTLMDRYPSQFTHLATKNRLPSIHELSDYVEAGGLMSYASSDADSYRRAAWYVDKILKGAKPNDLPVEQPTKFELVINLKTAKQIGLTIPPNVLARADRVIR